MLFSTVVNPSIFDPNQIAAQNLSAHVLRFAQALTENLVMPVDKSGKLEKAILLHGVKLAQLPNKGPQISGIIAEIVKRRREKLIPFMCGDRYFGDELCKQLSAVSRADAVVTLAPLVGAAGGPCTVIDIADFMISQLETLRRQALGGYHDLDKRASKWLTEQISRTCRGSQEVIAVDPMFLRAGRRKWFLQGLSFFVQSILLERVPAAQDLHLRIVSAPHFEADKDNQIQKADIKLNADIFLRKLSQHLNRELGAARPKIRISLSCKSDDLSRRLLHDRYWASDYSVVKITRGFDFFSDNGDLYNQSLFWADSARPVLAEVLALPDEIPPQTIVV